MTPSRAQSDDEVICPNCVHQFRAIPVNVQRELAQAREEARRDREDAERYRWLRMNPNFMGWEHDFLPNQVDAAIDAVKGGK